MFVTDFADLFIPPISTQDERNFLYGQGNLTGTPMPSLTTIGDRHDSIYANSTCRHIGTGVIGASWAALYLARGLQRSANDIAPTAGGGAGGGWG